MLLSGGIGYFFVIKPILRIKKANNWIKTPCTITSSELKINAPKKGIGSYPEICFTYNYNGEEYESKRCSFWDLPASDTSLKHDRAVTEKYLVGMKTWCFVNPANPQEAVLVRGHSSKILPPLLVSVIIFICSLILFIRIS